MPFGAIIPRKWGNAEEQIGSATAPVFCRRKPARHARVFAKNVSNVFEPVHTVIHSHPHPPFHPRRRWVKLTPTAAISMV